MGQEFDLCIYLFIKVLTHQPYGKTLQDLLGFDCFNEGITSAPSKSVFEKKGTVETCKKQLVGMWGLQDISEK